MADHTDTQADAADLRDRFAAAALSGLLAAVESNLEYPPDRAAAHAYRYADAMLAARERTPGPAGSR